MATEVIRIVVQTTGTKQAQAGIKGIGVQAKRTSDAAQILRRTLGFIGVTTLAKGIAGLSDAFIGITNRIRTVTESVAETNVVMQELFEISNRTRGDFETTAETFARLSSAASTLGFSQQNLLTVSERLNEAIVLSGATSREARTALIQLSQGFARGQLRGDELRSTLEQLPAVADIIAQELKVSRFELARLGEQGKITTDSIINAFLNAEDTSAQFAKTVPTIGQAFTVVQNKIVEFIGEFNNATGASEGFSRFILVAADNVETFARAIGAAAIVLGVVFGVKAINKAITGIIKLNAALLANPFTAVAVAITTLIALFITFGDRITFGADKLVNLKDIVFGFFDVVRTNFAPVGDFFKSVFRTISESFDSFTTGVGIAADALGRFLGPAAKFALFFLPGGAGILQAASAVGAFAGQVKKAAVARATLRKEEEAAAKLAEDAARRALSQPGTRVDKVDPQLAKDAEKFAKNLRRLEAETVALKLNSREREIALELVRLEQQQKLGFQGTQEAELKAVLEANRALEERNALLDDITQAQTDLAVDGAILKKAFDEGKISVQQFNKAITELRIKSLDSSETLSGKVSADLLKFKEDLFDISDEISGAFTSAFDGLTDVFVNFAETGKLSFKDLANSIISDIIRIATQQLLTRALFGDGASQPGGAGLGSSGGIFGFLGSVLGGAANGADFRVGGSGGTDSQMVAFRATPGERVQVSTPDGRTGGGRPVQVIQNISTPDVTSFGRSQGQLAQAAAQAAARAQRRNG